MIEAARASTPGRPRIVFLDHCSRLSGAELGLLRLLPALSSYEVRVILAEDGPLVDRLRDLDVPVEVVLMRESARGMSRERVSRPAVPIAQTAATVAYALRIARRLRDLRPDLVHAYSLKAVVYGGVAALTARVPLVWHLHDRVAEDYMPADAMRLMRWIGPKLSAHIIVNSEETLKTLQPPLDLRNRCSVIAYPVADEYFLPHARDRRPFTVGMVGRLAPWKGQDVFIRAFARAFPSGPARAIIVGSPLFGERAYEFGLKQLAADLGVSGRIEFAGFREDVRGQLDRIDALVHASVIPEPFGQVVIEGMAAGLPVVATAAGGPAEVIHDGVDGFLYPPGDVVRLAGFMRRLAADESLRTAAGARARVRAGDFRPAVIAREVSEVYERVIGRHPVSTVAVG
jgi:glycosyltransferase involved in cell wall biosynthesis